MVRLRMFSRSTVHSVELDIGKKKMRESKMGKVFFL